MGTGVSEVVVERLGGMLGAAVLERLQAETGEAGAALLVDGAGRFL